MEYLMQHLFVKDQVLDCIHVHSCGSTCSQLYLLFERLNRCPELVQVPALLLCIAYKGDLILSYLTQAILT